MSIVIHVGSWKTATTLLQTVLRTNRQLLEQHDVHFVDHRSAEYRESFAPAFRDAVTAHDVPEGEREELDTRASNRFIRLGDPGRFKSVVHLNEGLLGHPVRSSPGVLHHAEQTARWFESFICGYDYQFVIYIRSQASFLEAMYAQEVRKGRFLGMMDEFLESFGQRSLSWQPVVEPFVRRFGSERTRVVPFETIRHGGEQFIRSFFDLFIPNVELRYVDYSNPSFSEKAIELARTTYANLDQDEIALMERFLVENFSTRTHGRSNLIGDLRREQILLQYRDDNRYLFETWLPDFDPELYGYC